MHMMIDLETLGTRPDAAIIQVGAVMFEPRGGGRVFNDRAFGRHVLLQDGSGSMDHGTLCFWLKERSARQMGEALSAKAYPLADVLSDFIKWGSETDGPGWDIVEGVWALPADFDLAILRSAFARFGLTPPWDRRATRCLRTLLALTPPGAADVDRTGFTRHDAVDDATCQAMSAQKALAILAKK